MAETSKTVALLPCPFCGGPAETDSRQAYRALSSGPIGHAAAIYCTGACSAQMTLCHADVSHLTPEDALAVLVENWNRRAAPETSGDKGKISDGYHTFDELYDHRCHLFVALVRSNPGLSWRSKLHSDGSGYPSWFIAGMKLVSGPITYHLPLWMWSMLEGISTHDRAPEWDGHTAADVVKRLHDWNERSAQKATAPLACDRFSTGPGKIFCSTCERQEHEHRTAENGNGDV